MAEGPTLSIDARVTRHGHRLEVRLEVPPGITCVLGPSGAGKSTLLGAIAGLVHPGDGRIALGDQVWFDGQKGIDVAVERRRVAYVFQSLALFPHLTAVGNVEYGMPRHVPRQVRDTHAMQLLARVGVSHLAHRRPRTFSGGEAQRVALARALAMQPSVVLLDEPFSALDRPLRVQLATLVRDLVDELGVPLLHVTHSESEAKALADRVVRLEHGKVVAEGPAEDVAMQGTPMPEIIRKRSP